MSRILITLLLCACTTPLGQKGTDSGATGSSDLSLVGTECDEGGIFDCDLECWVTDARDYIGDSECDDGERGPNFDCIEMNNDDGDCASDETTGDGSTTGGDDGGTDGAGGTNGGGTNGGGAAAGGGGGSVGLGGKRF